MEAGTSGFTIFGNEVEEIYRAKTQTLIILLYEIWVTQQYSIKFHYISLNIFQ